jgi:hypothetical protein
MGNRDARHTLEGIIEMDEGYFGDRLFERLVIANITGL